MALAAALMQERFGKKVAKVGLGSMLPQLEPSLDTALPFQPRYSLLADHKNQLISNSYQIMVTTHSHDVNMHDLSEMLGVSSKELQRVFSYYVGIPPMRLMRNIRLDRAKWELTNSRKSIAQIAYDNAFFDPPHFSRWFKQEFGQTPSAYRRAHLHLGQLER